MGIRTTNNSIIQKIEPMALTLLCEKVRTISINCHSPSTRV